MALRIRLYTCAPFVHCRIRAAEKLEVLQSPRSGLEESMNITGMSADCSERGENLGMELTKVAAWLLIEGKMFGSFQRSGCRHLLTKSSVNFDPPSTEEDLRSEEKRNS
ncbi:hypothetical protein TSAR_010669, partial [Trichomalopsis sarcophagae]